MAEKLFHQSVIERIEKACDVILVTSDLYKTVESVAILCSFCELISDTFIPKEHRKELANRLNLSADKLSRDLSRNKTVNILRITARSLII